MRLLDEDLSEEDITGGRSRTYLIRAHTGIGRWAGLKSGKGLRKHSAFEELVEGLTQGGEASKTLRPVSLQHLGTLNALKGWE